jgi:hypothetical protein
MHFLFTKDEDLEGDFDPEQHDKRMRQLFNREFYEGDENEKPDFPELDEELEIGKQNATMLSIDRIEVIHFKIGCLGLRFTWNPMIYDHKRTISNI